MIGKLAIRIMATIVFLFPFAESTMGQFQGTMRYPKGRLFMSDGRMIDGKNVIISPDSVSINIGGGFVQTSPLSEVQQIMVKKGLAPKWTGGCGCGSASFFLVTYLILLDDPEFYVETTGVYLISAVFWTALSSGVGYLIGTALDGWQTVYFAPRRAHYPKPSHLGMEFSPSEGRLVWSYRF